MLFVLLFNVCDFAASHSLLCAIAFSFPGTLPTGKLRKNQNEQATALPGRQRCRGTSRCRLLPQFCTPSCTVLPLGYRVVHAGIALATPIRVVCACGAWSYSFVAGFRLYRHSFLMSSQRKAARKTGQASTLTHSAKENVRSLKRQHARYCACAALCLYAMRATPGSCMCASVGASSQTTGVLLLCCRVAVSFSRQSSSPSSDWCQLKISNQAILWV